MASDFMSRAELMARTGYGPRSLNAAIRRGEIPGHVTKAGKPRVPRIAYEKMIAGEHPTWKRPAVGITRIGGSNV